MLRKTQVLHTLQEMPEEFSIDEMIDKLILLQNLEVSLQQSEKREVYSTEEAKALIKKWSK